MGRSDNRRVPAQPHASMAAIAGSIWSDALKGFLAGEIDREIAVVRVAENYLQFLHVYERQPTPSSR